jgi:ABC-type lipoprotein export system ATPase subunit
MFCVRVRVCATLTDTNHHVLRTKYTEEPKTSNKVTPQHRSPCILAVTKTDNTTTTPAESHTSFRFTMASPIACIPEQEQTSTLSSTNYDPFQKRQGKTLVWRGVNMKFKEEKQILQNVWGQASNETTAILGPSGSGKTSLLNILAGRAQSTSNMAIEASITLDGVPVNPSVSLAIRRQIAFVAQEDALNISSTPREAIYFSARLRLPAATTTQELTSLTVTMLAELGLNDCADTMVGGALLKGISGGERKRTSVGVELVTKPSIVFLDEPTSGTYRIMRCEILASSMYGLTYLTSLLLIICLQALTAIVRCN